MVPLGWNDPDSTNEGSRPRGARSRGGKAALEARIDVISIKRNDRRWFRRLRTTDQFGV